MTPSDDGYEAEQVSPDLRVEDELPTTAAFAALSDYERKHLIFHLQQAGCHGDVARLRETMNS